MRLKFIAYDFKMGIITWLRSKGTVFWTILFPILLILIFGAIFSGTGEVEYKITVQNFDLDEDSNPSNFSIMLIDSLKNISIFEIDEIDINTDIDEYMKEEEISAGIVILEGFDEDISMYLASKQNPEIDFDTSEIPSNLTLKIDPSDQSSTPVLRSVLLSVIYEMNLQLTQGEKIIGLNEESIIGDDFEFIDFFVPGMIGFTIMTSAIYGSIERNTKYRTDGILRKMLTMPITRAEWIISKMLFMLFLSFISTAVILTVGILVWGLNIHLNIWFLILIISNSFLFSGMGMLVSRFVKEQETADMAGGAITFPMMFLAGTFFPLEQMPDFLQTIARFLPLYYVNEGLRNAMITVDIDKTIYFTAFVVAFALFFFITGAVLTKWKED
jgi:ABC-2 type transport system permease protein